MTPPRLFSDFHSLNAGTDDIEDALRKSNARFEAVFRDIGNGVAVFEPLEDGSDFTFKDINPAGEKAFKLEKSRIIGKRLTELFPYVREFGLLESITRVHETGIAELHPDIQYENDALVGWRKHRIRKLPTGELISVFSDETHQKRTELALLDFEGRYRTLFNYANDAIIVHDSRGRIIDVNCVACDLLGYSREELLSKSITGITDPSYLNSTEKRMQTASDRDSLVFETMYMRKNGDSIPIEVSSRVVEYDQKPVMMTLARDITERKRAEADRSRLLDQLRHSQKMEAIGTLAGGIAHDFNNILQAIIGYAEISLGIVPEEGPLKKYLSHQYRAANRARELVHQILTFSRRNDPELKPVRIQPIIKESLKLLEQTLPSTIAIRSDIDSSCGHIIGNPTQVQQILMNLCTNAYHALRDTNGRIHVRLTCADCDVRNAAGNDGSEKNRYLELRVSDTGCGMGKSELDRIFEPYFTTKRPGEGTGLGLSMVHGIVTGMNGHIRVESEKEKGTTFHIYLPEADSENHTEDVTGYSGSMAKGSERILIVDDEKDILDIQRIMLERLGYDVTTRLSSVDALELFKNKNGYFDLVITDVTMPNLTGVDLAKKIIDIRPEIPVILCSGFSEFEMTEAAKKIGIKKFLMKPVGMWDLAISAREALDNACKRL